jgi:16S rRNA (cytidine1402-2'-O)-methyltransferase
MPGKLFVLGNHIGNPGDVGIRFSELIKSHKNIVCEDDSLITDKTKNIIVLSFDDNDIKIPGIMQLLYDGEDVLLVSDEGMPGIADPGSAVLKECINNNIEIHTTPGPSTIIAAAVVANVLNRFMYHGFLPHDEYWAHEFLNRVAQSYSPHIFLLQNITPGGSGFSNFAIDALDKFITHFGEERRSVLCFNLTTEDQEIFRGTLRDCMNFMNSDKRPYKNACIVIDDIQAQAL